MNLSEYFPIINNAIPLYVNSEGLITTDRKYHETIYKLTILYYWNRFAKCVRHDKLWSIFTQLQSLKTDNFFLFTTSGLPYNAPPFIGYLIRKEQERLFINSQWRLQNSKKWYPNTLPSLFITIYVITLMLFSVFRCF